MDAEALRAEIARLGPWHHDVEVVPGLRTGDVPPAEAAAPELGTPSLLQPDRQFVPLMAQFYPGGLAGRSFLDCACNAGGYVFAARALGAGRGFGFDVREHWIEQARFLARHRPSEGLEFETLDLMDLPARGLPLFDVTWFSGIFYHLPDPIAGLRIAADRTADLIVVNTQARPGAGPVLALKPESPTRLMSGVHGLAWVPGNVEVLEAILAWCGFPHSRLIFDRPAKKGFHRVQIAAARDARIFEPYDRVAPPAAKAARSSAGGWRRRLRRLLG
jgi:tRNA (mo5U34)-methyltransferase